MSVAVWVLHVCSLDSGWWLRCLDIACALLALQLDERRCMGIARVLLCHASLSADVGVAVLILLVYC